MIQRYSLIADQYDGSTNWELLKFWCLAHESVVVFASVLREGAKNYVGGGRGSFQSWLEKVGSKVANATRKIWLS